MYREVEASGMLSEDAFEVCLSMLRVCLGMGYFEAGIGTELDC